MWLTPLLWESTKSHIFCVNLNRSHSIHSTPYLNSALEDKSVDGSKLEELLLGEPAHYLGWFHGGAQAAGEQDQEEGGEQHTTLHCVKKKLQTEGF